MACPRLTGRTSRGTQRLVDLALSWLASGKTRPDGIVTPIMPFAESAEAYRAIDEGPEESIKLVRF